MKHAVESYKDMSKEKITKYTKMLNNVNDSKEFGYDVCIDDNVYDGNLNVLIEAMEVAFKAGMDSLRCID